MSAAWCAEHDVDPAADLDTRDGICALWLVTDTEDFVLHARSDSALHRQQFVLHELAHAYHDQILGFDDPEILRAYNDAKKKGIYEKVLLHTGREVRHYAATDHKEYFAEATEAYLYRNDFYPFVAAELRRHDPAAFTIMENVWGLL